MREISVNPASLHDVKRLKQNHYDMGLLVEVQAVPRHTDLMLLDGGYEVDSSVRDPTVPVMPLDLCYTPAPPTHLHQRITRPDTSQEPLKTQ